MEYSKMSKSISELTNDELDHIIKYGHLNEHTKEIKELWKFFDSIEEEKKRRNLQLKEIQKNLPI